MKISTYIGLLFIIELLVVAGFGLFSMHAPEPVMADSESDELVTSLQLTLLESEVIVLSYVQEEDIFAMDALSNRYSVLMRRYKEGVNNLAGEAVDVQSSNILRDVTNDEPVIEQAGKDTLVAYKSFLKANEEAKIEFGSATNRSLANFLQQTNDNIKRLDNLITIFEANEINLEKEYNQQVEYQNLIETMFSVGVVVVAVLIFLLLYFQVARPLQSFVDHADEVGKGGGKKLDDRYFIKEMSDLADSLNTIRGKLESIFKESLSDTIKKGFAPTIEKFAPIEPEIVLEQGLSYLVEEDGGSDGYSVLMNTLSHGREGLIITRTLPRSVRKHYALKKTPIIWLSERATDDDKTFSTINFTMLSNLITSFVERADAPVVFFDRFDYLVKKHGFDDSLDFLESITDAMGVNRGSMIVSLESVVFTAQQLGYLRKELSTVPVHAGAEPVREELIEFLRFIDQQQHKGKLTQFKDIKLHFNITAPTVQKKISELQDLGMIRIVKQGRSKTVHLTKQGQSIV